MKLAAMEGLYRGQVGQGLVGLGFVDTEARDVKCKIEIPYGLSILANHDPNTFVPGIDDIIDGISLTPEGDTIRTESYAERIKMGRKAIQALRDYEVAKKEGNEIIALAELIMFRINYPYFGYAYLDSPEDAVPPVALAFYSFRVMVMAGGYLLLLMIVALFVVYRKPSWLDTRLARWIGVLSIPVVWICSEAVGLWQRSAVSPGPFRISSRCRPLSPTLLPLPYRSRSGCSSSCSLRL